METRGRKRRFNPTIPAYVDQTKLPRNCYWHNGTSKHWYTTYKDERGKQRRKRIAGPDARLSELHQIIEENSGVTRNTFTWLIGLFRDSPQYGELSQSTKRDYQYCEDVVKAYPTRINQPLGVVPLSSWDNVLVQKLIDKLSQDRGPSSANHVLRFIRRVFRWGLNRGFCTKNPVLGIESAKEKKKQRLPSKKAFSALLAFAKNRSTRTPRTEGSCPFYLWMIMELAYLCRLRGIEVITLTDSNVQEKGLLSNRRKGSRDNITVWNDRLWHVIQSARKERQRIWDRKHFPVTIKDTEKLVIVGTEGYGLKRSSLDSAWQRFIKMAMEENVIAAEDRFSLHDLKRRGATDTTGTKADKQEATGHRSEAMLQIYDKSVPVVKPSSD